MAASRLHQPTEDRHLQSLPGCHLHSQDFCYTDSESSSEGQYVDLILNPERFTGYAGPSAHRVWGAIYEENCFGLSEKLELQPARGDEMTLRSGLGGGGGLSSPGAISALQEGFGHEMRRGKGDGEECLEKRIYYRIISGAWGG